MKLVETKRVAMSDDYLEKETLGLAAEFAVASELCRRGIYAQLTLGNRKRTDLLVDVEGGGGCVCRSRQSKSGNGPH